ncbi:MAG TPA: response regulator transcription factor [Thermoanaerobaculia bacterium]|nr:response regulator transcription factor [Thermoanaerobaculia bacterium]
MSDFLQPDTSPLPRVKDVDRKRVLVVDDDLPLRGMLSAALRQGGYQVLLAGDGGEAERAVTLHSPHLVLLDLMMPGINGWDFLQKMKETGRIGSIPIIVISAHLRTEPQAILDMGVTAILPKPFNLDELLQLVEHFAH